MKINLIILFVIVACVLCRRCSHLAAAASAIVRESCSGIAVHLRWFSSAAALVNRQDRTEALLDRHEKCPTRLQEVEALYQRFILHLENVTLESFSKERWDQVYEDYVQIMDMIDDIAKHAQEVLATIPIFQCIPINHHCQYLEQRRMTNYYHRFHRVKNNLHSFLSQ